MYKCITIIKLLSFSRVDLTMIREERDDVEESLWQARATGKALQNFGAYYV